MLLEDLEKLPVPGLPKLHASVSRQQTFGQFYAAVRRKKGAR